MNFSKPTILPFITLRFVIPIPAIIMAVICLMGCHSNKNGKNGNSGESDENSKNAGSSFYKYLVGTVNNRKAILQLVKYNDRVEGVLIDSAGQPLPVSGKRDSSDQLTLISYEHYNPVDTFTGDFSQPGVFQGFWNDTSDNHGGFVFQEMYANGTYRWKVYVLNDSLAFDTVKNSPMARLQMNLLWPSDKNMPALTRSLIVDTIIKRYTGNDTATESGPEAVLKNAADSFFYHYEEMKKELSGKDGGGMRATFNWEYDATMNILWNANDIASLAFRSYQYTGGAHGLGTIFLTVFDLKLNKVLTLNDIFVPGYKAKLQSVLENKLREEFEIPANSPLNGNEGILFDKHLALTKNFYLTGSGIGFIYNPYEVAPYVVGQIELFVPFSEIRSILKKRD